VTAYETGDPICCPTCPSGSDDAHRIRPAHQYRRSSVQTIAPNLDLCPISTCAQSRPVPKLDLCPSSTCMPCSRTPCSPSIDARPAHTRHLLALWIDEQAKDSHRDSSTVDPARTWLSGRTNELSGSPRRLVRRSSCSARHSQRSVAPAGGADEGACCRRVLRPADTRRIGQARRIGDARHRFTDHVAPVSGRAAVTRPEGPRPEGPRPEGPRPSVMVPGCGPRSHST
jgi:hypothetical protein